MERLARSTFSLTIPTSINLLFRIGLAEEAMESKDLDDLWSSDNVGDGGDSMAVRLPLLTREAEVALSRLPVRDSDAMCLRLWGWGM